MKPVASVEVVDPHTVRLQLAQPYAPLVAVLADRAGMMISPKALRPRRDAGPALRRPVQADRTRRTGPHRGGSIPGYWNAGAIKLDRIVYQPIPDTTVRLVNLQAGQLDMVERLGPTDVAAVKRNPKLQLISQTALAYYTLTINLAADTPLKDPRVRAALEAAIDRSVINQVVMDGQFIPSNQFEAPGSRYWDPDHPVPPRDVAKAKALLKEAGIEHPSFTLTIGNSPVEQQVGQVIQSMAGEAGFDIKLHAMEANALVAAGQGRRLPGDGGDLERPARSGRQRRDLAGLRRLPELGQVLQSEIRRPAGTARGVTDVAQRQALYQTARRMSISPTARISCCIMRSGCGRCPTRCPASRRRRTG